MKSRSTLRNNKDLSVLIFFVFDIRMYYKYLFLRAMKHYLSTWPDKKEKYMNFLIIMWH